MIPRRIDAEAIIRESILPEDTRIIRDGIRDQLRRGIVDPTIGGEKQRTYSPSYKKKRSRKGLQTDYIDLRYTRQLYNGVKVTFTAFTLRTDNTANTYTQLTSRYSWAKNSMNVTSEVMQRFKNRIMNRVARKIL